jgi:hypothetical protein
MKPLSKQVQFNRMVRHLRGMKRPAMESNNLCAYLTADGSKCAVGALIPEGHKGQWLSAGVTTLLITYPDLKDRIDEELGHEMQLVHDSHSHWDKNGLTQNSWNTIEYIRRKHKLRKVK